MKVLGIETTGSRLGVCLWEDFRVRAVKTLADGESHSQHLLPTLNELFKKVPWTPHDLDTLAMLAMSQRDFVLVEDDRRELDYLNNAAEYLSRPGGDYCAFRKRALALQVVRNAVALTVSVGQERTLPEVIQALLRLDDLTLLLARARRAEAELAELQSPDIPF
jgi:hypothetical protein